MRNFHPGIVMGCAVAAVVFSGCGVIPVPLTIDSLTMEVSIDKAVTTMEGELKKQGILPEEWAGLPEVWPDSLPDLQYSTVLESPATPFDLTPDPALEPEKAKQYEKLDLIGKAIRRIELNHLGLRLEQNTTNIPLPAMTIQMADDKDAKDADRAAWTTIGAFDGAEPGAVTDIALKFARGGAAFLNAQLLDAHKEFALRGRGRLEYDTETNPERPHGTVTVRLIVAATFFVELDKVDWKALRKQSGKS